VELIDKLYQIRNSVQFLYPELVIASAIIICILISLRRNANSNIPISLTILVSVVSTFLIATDATPPAKLFSDMLQKETFSSYLKLLVDISAILTCIISYHKNFLRTSPGEFCAALLTTTLGCHFLLMSTNLLSLFLSLETVSISSYILAGFASTKKSSEGSLKYFIFGSIASAIMLYGFSILYGMAGTLDIFSENFIANLLQGNSSLVFVAGVMALCGFLFKISAAPMHPWAPDVYESAPIPVVAFFSVAPKLAGMGILAKFIIAIHATGQSFADWQTIISIVAIITLTIGNFAALAQQNAMRMMAYSSIAQSGFMLVGIAAFIPQGLHFMLFYASIYMLMNFAVFTYLHAADEQGVSAITSFTGAGKSNFFAHILLLVALIALTGLPPTAGFSAKLFIFSALWESYQLTGKQILLWLLIFGLLNTVVSLFYYLKIPYFAFLKESKVAEKQNFKQSTNLLGLILVLLILVMFFAPGLLMGWINKVNFVF
jgi:NADH-quinone oxidoreductase subunit N